MFQNANSEAEKRAWLIQHSLTVLAISAMLFALGIYSLDTKLAFYFKLPELEYVYYYSREITNIGYSIHYLILALLGIFFSKYLYKKNNYLKKMIRPEHNILIYEWSVFLIKALATIGLLLQIPKFLIGRLRPHSSENFYNLNFSPFSLDPHWHSFPSGHTQVLFTVASIGLLIWPRYRYLFLLTACLFSLTRISTHQHFFSDMVAGAVLGYLGTLWLAYFWRK